MEFKIAVIPGDGIGVDVTRQAVAVLDAVAARFGHAFHYENRLVGGCCIDACGVPIQPETLEACRRCDAILFGAAGGPQWDHLPRAQRPEAGLGALRKTFNLFCNLRPAKVYPDLMENSPLKNSVLEKGLDLMLVRDLTGGIYWGEKGRREGQYGPEAYDVECYSEFEVERVARRAFEIARQRPRRLVTSIDKFNALESGRLWHSMVERVHEEYPDVTLNHMLVDNAAKELACRPYLFDVLLTNSIFGDILSDEAGVTTGSIGMLPSASINESGWGLFEPIHGTAPDIAGQGIANPLAAICAAAMLLRLGLGLTAEADAVESAVNAVLHRGYRTGDLWLPGCQRVSTEEMGQLVAQAVAEG